jgi:hypothetical protein
MNGKITREQLSPGFNSELDGINSLLSGMAKVVISDTAPILTNVVWVDTGNNAFVFPKTGYGSISNNTCIIAYFDKKILSIQNNLKCYTSVADRSADTNTISGICTIDGNIIKFTPTTYLPMGKIYCRLKKGTIFYDYTTSKNDLDFEFDTFGLLNSNFKEWDSTNLCPSNWIKSETNITNSCSISNGVLELKSGNATLYSVASLKQTLDMTRIFNGLMSFDYKTPNAVNTSGTIYLELVMKNSSGATQYIIDFYLNGTIPADTTNHKNIDLKSKVTQNSWITMNIDLLAILASYGFNTTNISAIDLYIVSNSNSANIMLDSYWSNLNFGEIRL